MKKWHFFAKKALKPGGAFLIDFTRQIDDFGGFLDSLFESFFRHFFQPFLAIWAEKNGHFLLQKLNPQILQIRETKRQAGTSDFARKMMGFRGFRSTPRGCSEIIEIHEISMFFEEFPARPRGSPV